MKTLGIFFFILPVLLPLHNASAGEIYKWVDKNGVLHFGQAPLQGAGGATKMESILPPMRVAPDVSRSQVTTEKTQPVEKKPPVVVEERIPVVTPLVVVEMYSTSWCGYCRKAREYFQTRGIPLIEYDVEVDAAAAQRKRQIDTSPGVPLVLINGQMIHGFAPAMYERALTGHP